jgi:hypothetical protein
MEEHQPGITELRINVKAAIAAANAFAKRLEVVETELRKTQELAAHTSQALDEQTKQMNVLKAKLYENGIR